MMEHSYLQAGGAAAPQVCKASAPVPSTAPCALLAAWSKQCGACGAAGSTSMPFLGQLRARDRHRSLRAVGAK